MDFDLSVEEQRWQQKVRSFLEEHWDRSHNDRIFEGIPLGDQVGGDPVAADFTRRLGEQGWLTVTWPREYGGMGLTARQELIFMQELDRAGAPHLDLDVTEIAAILIHHGTEDNRQHWLPRIASREIKFAIGYSEPDAGTDLASLSTRAELDGDEWVINGTKLWNTEAHLATHEWMLVRTSSERARHGGLSLMIVPMDAEGVSYGEVRTWGEIRTNQTFFDDVRVPRSYLVGEVNQGWTYLTAALDLHRIKVGFSQHLVTFVEDLRRYCARTAVDGTVLLDRPEVRRQLAQFMVEVDLVNLLSWEIAESLDRGESPTVSATAQKVLSSELRARLADFAMSTYGLAGLVRRGDARAPMKGLGEFLYRRTPRLRFAGGTNEVMRDIVAQRGLGLPRSARRAPSAGTGTPTPRPVVKEVASSGSHAG
ncbi:acyl-CoA dehydrogenase family protein [Cryptosporangium sp. NPDC051539]|uniref:acyl-CoA dehydrogenase family protein n=1 Tax=Cryptosporangium sp. NPDC051539 TaxID=3363962 RepID=UPI0037BA7D04